MIEGLWRIVTGQETAPTGSETEQAKFAARRDRALATVVLSVDTSLLYLVILRIQLSSGRNWQTNLRKRRGQQGWTYAANCTH